MPTTQNEAMTIINIMREYLIDEQSVELLDKLNEQVGKTTDNESVQITMQMLVDLFEGVKECSHTSSNI